MSNDNEDNRLSARASRYVKVGTGIGSVAAKLAGQRLFGLEGNRQQNAADLAAALGNLKGPLMKVAQLLATIPDAVPAEYAAELSQLQSQAPSMGPAFVRRRMMSELGPEWRQRFASFDEMPSASASLGQVHRATAHDGRKLATKLQYPDMQSAVEADLNQLKLVFAVHARMDPGVDTQEMLLEIGTRLREELDYNLEARHTRLYHTIFNAPLETADLHRFQGWPTVRVPEIDGALSTKRLLTMSWLDGGKLLEHKSDSLEVRNRLARAMFRAWWYPFSRYGVIHGDPHLGNYTVFRDGGEPAGINLLDFGCIRTFKTGFIEGVIDLYNGLLHNDRARVVHAYETWGFRGLTSELIDVLTIWAKFIYGPLLDDRERIIADGTTPAEYGRREVFQVKTLLKEKGPVTIPREFVFMDRAAIGLGGVFLHLDAKLNWYRMFNDMIDDFNTEAVAARQRAAFDVTGVPLPI